MDYNFRALGPLAFEQLVQALVVARYERVEVYGRGPDGGRDAVILDYARRGAAAAPAEIVRAVVQAKWVDVPDSDPQTGWRRFRGAVNAEMAKWREVERANAEREKAAARRAEQQANAAREVYRANMGGEIELRKRPNAWSDGADAESPWRMPDDDFGAYDESARVVLHPPVYDHLIFVTNASLSSVPGRGGYDKFAAEVPDWIEGLSFSGVEVWHYADLCALVDGNDPIRNTYFAGLVEGDVRRWLENREDENRLRVVNDVYASLLADFREDQLMEQGHLGELERDRYKLSDVFVDLPASHFGSIASGSPNCLTEQLVSRLDAVGRPQIVGDARQRFVVVGGPGQGKTTVSRFLGQLYRAAIARTATAFGPDADVAQMCADTFASATVNGISAPVLRRWPFRVVLSDYARHFGISDPRAAVPSWSGPPLLHYLQERINGIAQVPIERSELQRFMSDWPVFLILDGMDETPSSVRPALVEAIRQFEDSARQNNIDLATLITTRPQAVGTDFDQSRYQHLRVLPLNGASAQAYGEQLLKQRFSDQPRRYESNVARLHDAIQDPATSALFTTPLQVAILVLLLERRERLPESRFKLFDAYFRAIYDREENKRTDLAALLQRHRETIEAVHKRLALHLHLRAENTKGVTARATTGDLATVLRHLLVDAGNTVSLDERMEQLMGAIRDRLVFLISDVEGTWGFEVLSIQEYLVALAILDDDLPPADDAPVDTAREVLALTATSTRWRNVWLLAAGASFLRSNRARYRVMSVVSSVDYRNGLTQVAHPGAALAVDMIEDRIAHQFPEDLTTLVGLAMNAGDALPSEKAKTLIAALVELQHDPEIAPAILGSLQLVGRSGFAYWYETACRMLAEPGPLEAHARDLFARIPWRTAPLGTAGTFSTSSTHPLEILAIIGNAAKEVPNLTVAESTVLSEIRAMTGVWPQRWGVARRPPSNEAVVRHLTQRFTDREFVDGFASLLGHAFSAPRMLSPELLSFVNQILSLADRTVGVWPMVGEYTVLDPL